VVDLAVIGWGGSWGRGRRRLRRRRRRRRRKGLSKVDCITNLNRHTLQTHDRHTTDTRQTHGRHTADTVQVPLVDGKEEKLVAEDTLRELLGPALHLLILHSEPAVEVGGEEVRILTDALRVVVSVEFLQVQVLECRQEEAGVSATVMQLAMV
jgi:hypothetical protein